MNFTVGIQIVGAAANRENSANHRTHTHYWETSQEPQYAYSMNASLV